MPEGNTESWSGEAHDPVVSERVVQRPVTREPGQHDASGGIQAGQHDSTVRTSHSDRHPDRIHTVVPADKANREHDPARSDFCNGGRTLANIRTRNSTKDTRPTTNHETNPPAPQGVAIPRG
jgi:hypothetical protein